MNCRIQSQAYIHIPSEVYQCTHSYALLKLLCNRNVFKSQPGPGRNKNKFWLQNTYITSYSVFMWPKQQIMDCNNSWCLSSPPLKKLRMEPIPRTIEMNRCNSISSFSFHSTSWAKPLNLDKMRCKILLMVFKSLRQNKFLNSSKFDIVNLQVQFVDAVTVLLCYFFILLYMFGSQ